MRKKIWIISMCLLLFCGCKKVTKDDTHILSIIEERPNYAISMHYPQTNIKELDRVLEDYIQQKYEHFKENLPASLKLEEIEELNVDYTIDILNKRYYSITLTCYEASQSEITTYFFDKETKQFLSLENIIDDLEPIYTKASTALFAQYGNVLDTDQYKQNLKTPLFRIHDHTFTLYYNPGFLSSTYLAIIEISFPIDTFPFVFLPLKTQKTSSEVIENVVNDQKVNKIIDAKQKVVAITFDDGPSSYTKEIIEILKENDAVATFFILGNKVSIYKETLKQSVEFGNELGNHTFNHKWLTKLNDEEIKQQIQNTQEIIQKEVGYTPVLFRPSYGSLNKRVRKDVNLEIVMWTIDTSDWKYKSIDKIVSRAVENVQDGSIILMHETYERSKDALPKIIDILKKDGFEFVTVSELKKIQALRKNAKL